MNAPDNSEAYVRRFALLLANDETILDDERAVMRALVDYGADEGGVVAYADRIITLARTLRPERSKDPEARAEIIRRGRLGEPQEHPGYAAVIAAQRDALQVQVTTLAKEAAVVIKREAALRAGITVALESLNRSLAPNHVAIHALEDAVARADAIKEPGL